MHRGISSFAAFIIVVELVSLLYCLSVQVLCNLVSSTINNIELLW